MDIFTAISCNNLASVEYCIRTESDLLKHKINPLSYAVDLGRNKIAKYLVENTNLINVLIGEYPIEVAIRNSNEEMYMYLLNVHIRELESSMYYFCVNNRADMIELLLKNKVDPNGKCITGRFFFSFITSLPDLEVFLKYGANILQEDDSGNTILHYLVGQKVKPTLIKFVLDAGVDVNKRNHLGLTAINRSRADHVPLLLSYGADKENDRFKDSLDLFLLYCSSDS